MSEAVKVYAGAENIFSPIGATAEENFSSCLNNKTGISAHSGLSLRKQKVWVSRFGQNEKTEERFLKILRDSINDSLRQVSFPEKNERIIFMFSTTKGNIEALENGNEESSLPFKVLPFVNDFFPKGVRSFIVSNACISGSLALILAHDLISQNEADHVVVSGADLVSRFTVTGFESLHALSKTECRPFCKTRSGISLGEGAATIILSRTKNIFRGRPFIFLGGATSNDANHISGPSRTGEGLFRAIKKALALTDISADDIDFISAHGTGTLYNDDMEAVAFNRAGLQEKCMSSFKGYFGHTLGAAGVIETAMCLQSLKKNILLKNFGMQEPGTARPVNILTDHLEKSLKIILKTASGFGGCNAAFVLQKEITD